MARIPQDFIDQLLDRTDIVALIDARVSLKKAGHEYTARCPFHDERTPSFTVSPNKQFYHCFGCGAHGSAISFLMEYDRLEFRDAVEVLAQQAGLTLPTEAADSEPAGPPRQPLFDAMVTADRFFRQALRRSQGVIDYLKQRGVSGEMARRYGLGFAPDDWQGLAVRLRDPAVGEQAGLLIARNQGGYFDRFRNRLMFPIRDTRGRTIAFGGRALGDDKAKYLNSPETPLFHKSDHMYGLYEARQAERDLARIIVVEGYMDVIALAQHGFTQAVATLGTATTASHLTTLFRHTEEVMFCFDGDAAGVRAARKALEQSLPVMRGARSVRFLFMPQGQDPDTLVRGEQGPERFQQAIDEARPASKLLLEALTERLDLGSAEGRSALIENARGYIDALPPEAFRAELIGEIAALARLPADDLRRMYAEGGSRSGPAADKKTTHYRTTRQQTSSRDASGEAQAEGQIRVTPVSRALSLLLADTGLATRAAPAAGLGESGAAGAAILADAIDFFAEQPHVAVSRWIERYREQRVFERLQQLTAMTPPGSDEARALEFGEIVARLRQRGPAGSQLRARYDALIERQAKQPLDTDAARELNELHRQLFANREN